MLCKLPEIHTVPLGFRTSFARRIHLRLNSCFSSNEEILSQSPLSTETTCPPELDIPPLLKNKVDQQKSYPYFLVSFLIRT